MSTELLKRLEATVKRMTEGDEAWGPEAAADTEAEAEAGEGGADNAPAGVDAFDNYVLSIVASILDEYEMDEEEALDYVFYVADGLAEDGDLPPIPEDEDPQTNAEWLGKAQTMLFGELVLAALEAEAE